MPRAARQRAQQAHESQADVDVTPINVQDVDREMDDGEGAENQSPLSDTCSSTNIIGSCPPPGLKDISSLASWTVSSAKPGNGVAALRSPDLTTFWQSDGPQPHYINIHFFKLVSIAAIRLYLDSERDESYTPTKIQFLAGMAPNDLQQFSEMDLENPMGWKQVDFSGVGPVPDDMDDDDDDDDADEEDETDWCKQPILKAFVVQVRILENHQNGKDTHLRALQVFARDDGDTRFELASEQMRASPVARTDVSSRREPTTHRAQRPLVEDHLKPASWMMVQLR